MKYEKKCANALVALLLSRMGADGLSVSALAARLGISQGYMSQLLKEDKLIAAASDNLVRECASFLRIAPITAFLLAGRLKSEDFYEPRWSVYEQLEKALNVVATAQQAQEVAVTAEQLGSLPVSVRLLIVLLYESAHGTEIMPGRASFETLQAAWQPRVPFTVRRVKFR